MRLNKNRILAEVLEEQPTNSGLILGANDNLERHQAKVVDIGPKVKHFKIGETVRFNPNSVIVYDVEQKKVVFLREDEDIILRVNDKP